METVSSSNMQLTSAAVLMINSQGMLLMVQGQEYFVTFQRLPWLRNASIANALNVRMAGSRAIEWPDLDIDLELECLRHPERYPLVMKRTTDEALS